MSTYMFSCLSCFLIQLFIFMFIQPFPLANTWASFWTSSEFFWTSSSSDSSESVFWSHDLKWVVLEAGYIKCLLESTDGASWLRRNTYLGPSGKSVIFSPVWQCQIFRKVSTCNLISRCTMKNEPHLRILHWSWGHETTACVWALWRY